MKKNKSIKSLSFALACLLGLGTAGALVGSVAFRNNNFIEVSAAADSTIEKVYTGGLGSFKTKTSYGNWSWSKAANKSDTTWDLTAGEEITFTYSHTDFIFHIATGIRNLYDNKDFIFWMTVGSGTTQYEDQGLYDQIAFGDLSRRVGRTDNVIIHVKNNATSTKTFTFNSRWDDDSEAYDLLFAVTKGHASFSLDNQGGTGITSVPLRRHSPCPTPIPTPTKTGYVFKGYFTQTGGKGTKYYDADGKIIQSVYNFTGDAGTVIPLYAYWEGASYTVTLNKNGGTGGSNSVSAKYGSNMPSMTKPTKTGYNFLGYWDTSEPTGGTQYYNASGSSARTWDKTSAATLYARWSAKTSTVSFNRNGGTGGSSSVTATYDEAMPEITVPTREYHEFLGYYNSSTAGVKYYNADGTSARNWDKENASVTLYAHWLALGTTITLDKQGGTGGTNSVVAPNGIAMPSATMPTRSGYIFNGYFSGTNGSGTQYYNADGTSAKNWDSDDDYATLYASWTIKEAVQDVIDTIDDIGTVSYTPESKAKIDAAREAYDALPSGDKGGVSNYNVLLAAEDEYDDIRQEGVDNVENAINGIGVVTLDKENDIILIRNAYNALTDEQKGMVDPDVLDKLDAAEQRIIELKEAKTHADPVVDLIDAIGTVKYPDSKDAIEAAREAYDALTTDDQRNLVSNYQELVDAEAEYINQRNQGVQDVEDAINAIGTVTLDKEDDIVAARNAFNALTEEQKIMVDPDVLDKLDAAEQRIIELKEAKTHADPVVDLIDAIGTVKYPDSKDAIAAAREAYDALTTDDQRSLVSNYDDLTNAEAAYAQLRLDAIEQVKDDINAISCPLNHVNSGEEIETARSGYDALDEADQNTTIIPNYNRLVDAEAAYDVLQKIIDIDNATTSEEYNEKLLDAKEAYDELTDDQLAFIPQEFKTDLSDSEAANDVMKLIDAIGDVTYGGDNDSLEDIIVAETAYNALTDDQKDIVDEYNHDTLTHDRTVYDNVDEVADLIKAIPEEGDVDTYYDAVDAAKTSYDALSNEEKAILNADTSFAYEKVLEDNVAAKEVIELIEDIGIVVYGGVNDSGDAIDTANEAYAELTDDQKAIVDKFNHNVLVQDNTLYDHVDDAANLIKAIPEEGDTEAYYDAVDAAKTSYDALTNEEKALLNADTSFEYEKTLNDNLAAKEVIELIDEIGNVTYGDTNDSLADIVAGEETYAALTDDQKAIVDNFNHDTLTHDRTVYDRVDNVADLIKAIPEEGDVDAYYDAVDAAKTAYDKLTTEEKAVLNADTSFAYEKVLEDNVAAKEVIEKIEDIGTVVYGGENDSGDAIDIANEAYAELSDDQKDIVDKFNHNVLVQDNTLYVHVDEAANLIKDIPEASDTQAYYDAVDDAKEVYDNLTAEEKALLNADVSFAYEKELEDNVAAREVIELIQDIGDVTYKGGQNDSLADIKAAEDAYKELSAEQKAIVDEVNKDDLLAARDEYDNVHDAVELIEAIGEVKHGGENDSKKDIEAARLAYDTLSAEEKALVAGHNKSYQTLEDAEKVYDAMVAIDAIGNVNYDTTSEEAIEEARKAYNALTPEQKEQLGKTYTNTLTGSETKYDNLKKGATAVVVVFLIVVSLTIVGGVFVLFLLLRKKKDDKDDDNDNGQGGKPVKAMSVGGFIPFVALISHYVDPSFIALYVLIGVAVLVWLTILVIFLMKKKGVGPFKKKEMEEQPKAATAMEDKESSSEDEEEVVTVSDEKGNIFQIRFIKSFTAKLIQSPEETKKYYEELKNEVLSYKKTNSRVSWHFDSVNSGRNPVLKFAIRGKTLCVYFPLNADEYEDSKYKVEKVESKKFEDVPCLYRIKNDRRLEYAKDLIAAVAKKLGLEKGEEQHESYANLPYEENKPLIARGLIKEQKVQVNKPVEQAEPVVLETKVNSDGDEVVVTKDASGNIFEIRYIKSFTAKLSQSEKDVKDYYTILKNHVLSYKKVNSRVSWHFDSVNSGRNPVLKFAIRGKTLCVYFAFDASKLEEKYKVEEAKGKKYEDVPVLYRIKNDRRCEYAKQLIDLLMQNLGVSQGEVPNEDYRIKHESTKALLAKGLIKEVKSKVVEKKVEEHFESITVAKADEMMSDEKAEAAIEEDTVSKKREGKKEVVNIDTLSQNYKDGDTVTLDSLIEKKLVSSKAGYVKVLARGVLDKKLTVDLHDYSIQAVKMIVLMGGHAKKIK